jgi:hypothetical protein
VLVNAWGRGGVDEEFATREVAMEKTASQTKDNKKYRRKLIVTVKTLTCNEQRNSERAGHGGTLVAEAKSISAKQSNKNISGADRVAGDRRDGKKRIKRTRRCSWRNSLCS